jgi:hypothetical protein
MTKHYVSKQPVSNPINFIINQVVNNTLPFGRRLEFNTLYETFKTLYPNDDYTTIQVFGKQVKQVINYSTYRPHGKKRQMIIPTIEDCRKTINEYFKQDMFQNLTIEEVDEEVEL